MSLRKEVAIAIFVPLVIVATWIRNLDELAPLSTIANICIAFSLLVIVYDEMERFLTDREDIKAAVRVPGGVKLATYQTLPLFFGGVAFAFEGIGVVLPLENKMRRPEHAVSVVTVGMTMVVLLYMFFGVLGYLAFGAKIEASITFNLSSDNSVEKMYDFCAHFWPTKVIDSFSCSLVVSSHWPSCTMPTPYLPGTCCSSTSRWTSLRFRSIRD